MRRSTGPRVAYAAGGVLLAGFGVLLLVPGLSWLWARFSEPHGAVEPVGGFVVPAQLVQLFMFGLMAVGVLLVVAGALVAFVAAKRFWPDPEGTVAAEPHRTSAST